LTAYYGPEWESLASRMLDRWTPSLTGNTGLQLPSTMGRNHGTLTNFSNNGNDAYVSSPDRLALNFDGTNDSVDFGNILNLGSSPFSASCWMLWPAATANVNRGIIGKYGAGNARSWLLATANTGSMVSELNQTGTVVFYYQSNASAFSASEVAGSIGTTLNNGQWRHVIITFVPSQAATIFVDGRQARQITSSVPSSVAINSTALTISSYAGGNFFSGQLDDIIIFNTALTLNEITFIYEQGRGGGMLREPPKRRSFFVPTLPLPVRRRSSRFLTFPG
jgi:hypothetical protein